MLAQIQPPEFALFVLALLLGRARRECTNVDTEAFRVRRLLFFLDRTDYVLALAEGRADRVQTLPSSVLVEECVDEWLLPELHPL